MLALCAMIAGCTSVSAVDSLIDSKETSEPRAFKRSENRLVPADGELEKFKECFEEIKSIANKAIESIRADFNHFPFLFIDANGEANAMEVKNLIQTNVQQLDSVVQDTLGKYLNLTGIMQGLYVPGRSEEIDLKYLQKEGSESLTAVINDLRSLQDKVIETAYRAGIKGLHSSRNPFNSIPHSFASFPDSMIADTKQPDGKVHIGPILNQLKNYLEVLDNNKEAFINIFKRIARL